MSLQPPQSHRHFYHQLLDWEREHRVLSFLLEIALLLLIFFGLIYSSTSQLPVSIQWGKLPSYFFAADGPGPFLIGLRQTLVLSALALLLSLLFGYTSAIMRLSQVPSAYLIATLYIQLVRNTPLLVQIYVSYFLLSPLLGLDSFTTALLVLSLFEGSYASEIIRTSIKNVGREQTDAASALGMGPLQTQWLIVYPQAFRSALPILANQGVSLIKDSALASAIGVFELSRSAQSIQEQTFLPFVPWLGVCFIYFFLTFSLSIAVKLLERRLSKH